MLKRTRRTIEGLEPLFQLAIAGALTGVLAGMSIVLFRWIIAQVHSLYSFQSYIEMSIELRVLLPMISVLLLILLAYRFMPWEREVGVAHVIRRLIDRNTNLPWQNTVYQFIGAILCIVGGHSVGREGPCIHIGAASGSALGESLKLETENINILMAAGVAAAIGAAFDTPLAGVIFALEVVISVHSIRTITPIIIASVIATLISQQFFDPFSTFNTEHIEAPLSSHEFLFLIVMGISIGLLARLFIKSLLFFNNLVIFNNELWLRFLLAGFITALIGAFLPEVMGIGYNIIEAILAGDIALHLLIVITVCKLFLTACVLGLGLPAGLIAPTLVIGAGIGGIMSVIGMQFFNMPLANTSLYILLGMTAMMSATLQAPLAALICVLELTGHTHFVLPAMLVIIVSNLVAKGHLTENASVYVQIIHNNLRKKEQLKT